MNKTFKKFISLVLAVLMVMTVVTVSFVAFAEGVEVTEPAEDHTMMWEVFWQFVQEIYGFFKYIFHDVFLGAAA